jgi:uncharacterized surface protein with fasciclin (FAS1) repeats
MLIIPIIVVLAIGGIIAVILSNNNSNTTTENMEETTTQSNIVQLAQANSSLSTLVAAVTAGDLGTALSDSSASLTVFAPTNSAFAAIQTTVDTLLLPENKTQLQNVLQYHVVSSKVLSSDLVDGQVVTTLSGDKLKVRIIGGEVYINNSKVVTADVMATNGVVHVIDSVLVPGSFDNIVGTAVATPELSTLVAAVQAGELVAALSDENANYTVFAPVNSAFAAIQSTVDTLLVPENKAQLQNVLQYHVVSSEAFSSELTNGQVIQTLNGENLTISIENGEVFIVANSSKAKVVIADVKTSNGVVHVIDTVLVP